VSVTESIIEAIVVSVLRMIENHTADETERQKAADAVADRLRLRGHAQARLDARRKSGT
jgi:hypothetical protein